MKPLQYQIFLQRFPGQAATKKIFSSAGLALAAMLTHAQEVKIYPGCNLTLEGNINVVVNNTAFKNDGTFSAGNSTVSFIGSADTGTSYISGSSNTRFNNLSLNKSAYGTALKSAVGVKNVLTVSAGTLYADSNLTLLSDISNTARLAPVVPGANVLGKVMIERYVPARRAWRLITAPVTDGASIYNSWQNGGVYTPGRGFLVSCPGPTSGMDNANTSSMKTWDVSSQSWLPVTNTYASVSPSNTGNADNAGYFVFIRGDRNLNNFIIPNTNITTITGIGNLQVGTQTFAASATAGKYTLIGNPYASPINFNSLSRTNLVKRFYVWDPSLNAYGGFVVLDDIDNDGVYSKSVAGSAQTKEIQSTQAFLVETNSNGAASLSIPETAKSTTNNLGVFRPMSGNTESISTDLYLLNADSSLVLADGTLVEFNGIFNDGVTNEDALKFTNINENISMLRNGKALAIERRGGINAGDTLFLKLTRMTQRNYQLQITPQNTDHPELMAFLEDNYLAGSNLLNLSSAAAINFTVDANPASYAADRFHIVFRQAAVLPVSFISIKAQLVNDQVEVKWKTGNEANTEKYEVEKSLNGIDFSRINITNKNASGSYTWIDVNGAEGNNFYRIKSIDRDGSIKYSAVVSILFSRNVDHFTVEPNPVKGNIIQLHFSNQPAGAYTFNLMNSTGQLVHSSKMRIEGTSILQTLDTRTALPAGIYQLQIVGPANTTEIQKVIVTH